LGLILTRLTACMRRRCFPNLPPNLKINYRFTHFSR
jgi:hypothetical protein